jgi:CRP-like cAMP-binding protein
MKKIVRDGILRLEDATLTSLDTLGDQLLGVLAEVPDRISLYSRAIAHVSAMLAAIEANEALEGETTTTTLQHWMTAQSLSELLNSHAQRQHIRTYTAGEIVIREGDGGDEAYLVRSGCCEVYRWIEGKRVGLRMFQPGEVFGEGALLDQHRRTASVVATENGTCLEVINRNRFFEELDSGNPWVSHLVATLAARVRKG